MRAMLSFLSTAALILPAAAFAQSAAPSADDYVCALTGECGDAEEPAEAPETAAPSTGGRIQATRGFSLSAPTARPQPRQARPAPPRNRQVAARPARPAAAAAARERRVDLRLNFPTGSAALSDEAQAQIRTFAEALKRPQLANVRVRIEGHTDSSGSRAVNLALSQRRAQSVADFLASQGIESGRLEVRGYGPDRPIGGRSAAAPENRRVEAVRIS